MTISPYNIFKGIGLSLSLTFSTAMLSCGGDNHPQEGGYEDGEDSSRFTTMTVKADSAEIVETYTVSIQGCQDVDIYPQISGTITSVCVKEGQRVHRGQTLFVVDQVPYQAALRTAQANVQAAEATLANATLEYKGKQELLKENVISEYDFSLAKNNKAMAEAALEQARAAEMDAHNNLSYTTIKSPVDGVVGNIPFRVGTLVSSQMSQPMTTVSDNNQMYVYFSMSENQLRALIRQYGTPQQAIAKLPQIELQLNDGSLYNHPGRIETFSGVINPNTGTIQIRSVFPNPENMLWSGGIGNVLISHKNTGQIVIPQSATYEIQDKVIAYKVEDGVAKAVFLDVTPLSDGHNFLVNRGLNIGDIIVAKGVGLVREGDPIVTPNGDLDSGVSQGNEDSSK